MATSRPRMRRSLGGDSEQAAAAEQNALPRTLPIGW